MAHHPFGHSFKPRPPLKYLIWTRCDLDFITFFWCILLITAVLIWSQFNMLLAPLQPSPLSPARRWVPRFWWVLWQLDMRTEDQGFSVQGCGIWTQGDQELFCRGYCSGRVSAYARKGGQQQIQSALFLVRYGDLDLFWSGLTWHYQLWGPVKTDRVVLLSHPLV